MVIVQVCPKTGPSLRLPWIALFEMENVLKTCKTTKSALGHLGGLAATVPFSFNVLLYPHV